MSTTEPIRNKDYLRKLKSYYETEKPNIRNYTLIELGLNSALRISDLLNLKWKDVFDFENQRFMTHLEIIEMKTKKRTKIALNQSAISALTKLMIIANKPKPEMFIFYGRNGAYTHLSRYQAYRIIHDAAEYLDIGKHISCHSLRKTFGYHAWKEGIPPAMLMELYNHSSYSITKHYLGIDQSEKDSVYLNINL